MSVPPPPSTDVAKIRLARRGAAAFAFLFSVLYLATRTRAFTYDALTSVLTAERGGLFPFHPNHLFGNGLGWVAYEGLRLAHLPVRAIFVFQTVNGVVAGLAVGLFFYSLTRRFSFRAGVLGAAAFGFANAFWSEAVDAGAYAAAGLAVVILTDALVRLDSATETTRRPRVALAVGALVGVGILVHQMFLLSIPAFLLLFLSSRISVRRLRSSLYFFTGVFFAGIAPYALIARFYYGFGWREGLFWFFGPAGPRPESGILVHSWWQWSVFQNIVPLWRGLAESIVAPVGLKGIDWAGNLGAAAVLILFFVGSLRLFFRDPQKRPLLTAIFAWIVLMNAFQFFWLPGAIRFRILFLPVLVVGILLSLEEWIGRFPLSLKRGTAVVPWLILGLGVSNGLGKFLPARRIENNRDLVRALWVGQTMGPNDFFLFSGGEDSILNVVPPYFAPGVPSRSLYGYFFSNPHGDFSEIGMKIDETVRGGGTVFIEERLLRKESWAGLSPDEATTTQILSRWFSKYEVSARVTGPFHYQIVALRLRTSGNVGA